MEKTLSQEQIMRCVTFCTDEAIKLITMQRGMTIFVEQTNNNCKHIWTISWKYVKWFAYNNNEKKKNSINFIIKFCKYFIELDVKKWNLTLTFEYLPATIYHVKTQMSAKNCIFAHFSSIWPEEIYRMNYIFIEHLFIGKYFRWSNNHSNVPWFKKRQPKTNSMAIIYHFQKYSRLIVMFDGEI